MAKLTQEDLLEIFHKLKKEVQPYQKGTVVARMDIEGKYDLWSEKKDINTDGRIRNEISFVTLIIQSSYVGFYYMPIYCCETVRSQIGAELMKTLKGKACFHIKSTDPELMKQIKDAMKIGYKAYKERNWIG